MMMQLKLEIKTFSTFMLVGLLAASALLSWAETLRDPTQIPAGIASPESNAINNSQANPQNSGPVLQSVMLSAQYRAAIINGKKVLLGKKYEQATLIALSEYSATLRNQDGTKQTLTMDYNTVKKTSPVKMSFQPPSRELSRAIKPAETTGKTNDLSTLTPDTLAPVTSATTRIK